MRREEREEGMRQEDKTHSEGYDARVETDEVGPRAG